MTRHKHFKQHTLLVQWEVIYFLLVVTLSHFLLENDLKCTLLTFKRGQQSPKYIKGEVNTNSAYIGQRVKTVLPISPWFLCHVLFGFIVIFSFREFKFFLHLIMHLLILCHVCVLIFRQYLRIHPTCPCFLNQLYLVKISFKRAWIFCSWILF